MTAIVPFGLTARQVGHRKQWATRREKYGPCGSSVDGAAKRIAAALYAFTEKRIECATGPALRRFQRAASGLDHLGGKAVFHRVHGI